MAISRNPCVDCPTRALCLGAGLDACSLKALGTCVRTGAPSRKGDYLYRAGDVATGSFVVRSGAVQTVVEDAAGEAFVTGFHFAGDLLGLECLDAETHTESAMAIETATVCRILPERVDQLCSIGLGAALLRLIGRSERRAIAARVTLSQASADRRVARFLLDLSRRMHERGRDARQLPLPMRRTDLASHLGMTPESLSRVFARFTRDGLIHSGRNDVALDAPARLQQVAEPATA